MKIPELLVPAGDLEKLRTAVRFGADAVYIGGEDFSLRTAASEFSLEEVEVGVRFAHERGVKVYLALNIFPYDAEIKGMMAYLKKTIPLGIDAVVVSDPGFLEEIQQKSLGINIHLSTQANTTNAKAVRFWGNQGVKRVVLARELNLLQIAEIKKKVPKMELEVFLHGAMCLAYSGRCLLSRQFTGREANKGECAQPCRWKYHLTEDEDRTRQLEVETGDRGSYILNAKDLCMIEHIPELIKTGIDSLKIEGRMKSAYYVAIVTKIYRQAIDLFCTDPKNYRVDPGWLEELENVSHRPYSTGFFFGEKDGQHEKASAYIKKYDFAGVVLEYDAKKKMILVQARNRIRLGDKMGLVDPTRAEIPEVVVKKILKENGEALKAAHNQHLVWINCSLDVGAHSLLRIPKPRDKMMVGEREEDARRSKKRS